MSDAAAPLTPREIALTKRIADLVQESAGLRHRIGQLEAQLDLKQNGAMAAYANRQAAAFRQLADIQADTNRQRIAQGLEPIEIAIPDPVDRSEWTEAQIETLAVIDRLEEVATAIQAQALKLAQDLDMGRGKAEYVRSTEFRQIMQDLFPATTDRVQSLKRLHRGKKGKGFDA